MHRAKLDNGIPVLYGTDPAGHVVIQYPDGSQVRTTWTQVSLIESLIDHLRQAYACLLRRASTDPATPVDTLMRIDDLLFSLHQSHHSTSSGPPNTPNRRFAMAGAADALHMTLRASVPVWLSAVFLRPWAR